MMDECTSDLLGLLQLANGTVLHFNFMSYTTVTTLTILFNYLKNFKKVSV